MTHIHTRPRGPAALAVVALAITFVIAGFMLVMSMVATASNNADPVAPIATLATALVITTVATFAIGAVMRQHDESAMLTILALAVLGASLVIGYALTKIKQISSVTNKQRLAVDLNDGGGGTSSGNRTQMIILDDSRHAFYDDTVDDAARRWPDDIGALLGGAVNQGALHRDDGGGELFNRMPALAGT